MKTMVRIFRTAAVATALAASVLIAACGLDKSGVSPLTGPSTPSEFALSVTLKATPDQLPRDGSSQSQITVFVRDAESRPVSGQRLSVTSSVGSVSQSAVMTGADGLASFAFTAPPSGSLGNTAVIQVVPVGDNSSNAVARTLSISLTGASNTTPPTPAFTLTPVAPEANQSVRFDASRTTDEGVVCQDACTYGWNFGDGSTASGRIVNHTFTTARSYTVTLTVTDRAGATASTAQAVTVADVPAPSVTLSLAPDPPLAGQQATFTATATPATGHSITRFAWTFGDGTSQTSSTPTVTKTYSTQGVYVVTVTVTDDLGRTGSVSKQLTIANSAVTATIGFSPNNPDANQRIRFTALNPTAPNGATITSYEWNFGDSAVDGGGTASGQSVEHAYSVGTHAYVVRLTITDSQGHVGVSTKDVSVK